MSVWCVLIHIFGSQTREQKCIVQMHYVIFFVCLGLLFKLVNILSVFPQPMTVQFSPTVTSRVGVQTLPTPAVDRSKGL